MSTFLRKISVAILFVCLVLIACSPEPASPTKQSPVSLERLKEHLEYLASDETEGRMTGSDGYKKAADYTATNTVRYSLSEEGKILMAEEKFRSPRLN